MNLRAGPSTSTNVVRLLEPGEELFIHGSVAQDWVPIAASRSASDTIGFVSSDYLRFGPQPGYVIFDLSGNQQYIRGKIRNLTGRSLGYVQVTCVLLNDAGNQVGSTLANVNNLDAGRTWEFEAAVFESYSRFRCEPPTGF